MVDSIIGFGVASIFWANVIPIVAIVLGINQGKALTSVILITAFVYIFDIASFEPAPTGSLNIYINKFTYFLFSPYSRFWNGLSKGKVKLSAAITFGTAIFLITLSSILDLNRSQAFLRSSDFVINQTRPAFEVRLAECKSLSECPNKFKELAELVRAYSIPQRREGYVQILSFENGEYKAVSSDGSRFAPKPLNSQENEAKVGVFSPLFNKDFEQVVSMFRGGQKSTVELVSDTDINSGYRQYGKYWRSLHRISTNGKQYVVCILSNEQFLLTPGQQANMRN